MSRYPAEAFFRESKDYRSRLTQLMEENGCESPKQFAMFLGVNYLTIARSIIHGKVPSTGMAIKLADKLNLSLSYLLALSDVNVYKPAPKRATFQERLLELAQEKNETLGAVARNICILKASIYEWVKANQIPEIQKGKIHCLKF